MQPAMSLLSNAVTTAGTELLRFWFLLACEGKVQGPKRPPQKASVVNRHSQHPLHSEICCCSQNHC